MEPLTTADAVAPNPAPNPSVNPAVVPAVAPGSWADRLRRWAGILSAWLTAQSLTQLAGIAAGLLLIRHLPVGQFALYTLAMSVLAFFTFISDLGSTASLLHFFHRSSAEGEDFAPYFSAVLSLRRRAFLAGAAAVALGFPAIALGKGFAPVAVALVTAGIVVAVWFQIASSVRVLVLRLGDRYGLSYRAELSGALLRLALIGALVGFAWLEAWPAVLATALGTVLTAAVARSAEARPAAAPGGVDLAPAGLAPIDLAPYRRKVLRYLLPTLPGAVYFSIQGPLTVWLATAFGGTRNIAEVGALGRLGLVVGLFSTLSGVVFLPRLARLADDRLYRRRALQFGGFLGAIALAILAAAWLAPGPFLWLLGPRYSGLHRELLIVVGAAGLMLLDGYLVAVNMARSWTRWQGLAVLSLAAVQAGLAATLPLSSTAGVLAFNLLSSLAALGGQLAIATLGFTRPAWVRWS
jgi:O-antigen/teichoic acid export membrane protein